MCITDEINREIILEHLNQMLALIPENEKLHQVFVPVNTALAAAYLCRARHFIMQAKRELGAGE